MYPAVEAKLNKKERAQLKLAFTNDFRRSIQAAEVWPAVAILLAVLLLVVTAMVAGLTNFIPVDLPDEICQITMGLLIFAYYVGLQRQYSLVRKLHDIAAAALVNESEAESDRSLAS